jgi:hypothetical protein
MLINARRPAQRRRQAMMQHKPFIAPTGGWVSATNLAAAPPGSAFILENFYPTTTGIKMRSGSRKHATAEADEPLESAFSYVGVSADEMFGACNGAVYNLTSVADPDVAPTADITGQTSDYYSALNFTTVAGQYLLIANGTDDIQIYDGSSWSALASGSSPGELDGVDSDTISHLNSYRNRIWGVKSGTQVAYYWPTDSIAGTVGDVSLAGIFRKGGTLLFTATWSLDAGDGLDDKIAFVSTKGEVAIFQGDPVDSGWGLVGLYEAAPPLGKNASLKVGGDLLILTEIGLVPLTAVISKDPAALALAAVSRNIQPDWEREARQRRSLPWEIVKWTNRNICYISCPVTADTTITPPICFAVNLETGAWSKVTGWNTRCFVLNDDQVYFGTNDGTLVQADITGADEGEIIYYQYVGHMDHLGQIGRYKTVMQARAIFRTSNEFNPRVDVSTNYATYQATYPSAAGISTSPGEWDVGLWDVALWDGASLFYSAQTRWVSIGKSGFAHAPVVLITSGSEAAPSAELVTVEATFEPGGFAV